MDGEINLEELKYPVGKLLTPELISSDQIETWIAEISAFPSFLKVEVENLSPDQLEWRYRPGGWSIRQVVHHCADSHMNSFIRFKLALTEESPTIKPYYEDRWAELADGIQPDIKESLHILEGLHNRWVWLLRNMGKEDLKRTFTHPEKGRKVTLEENICLYAWHCRHHLAHVKQAKQLQGEF